MPYAFLVIVTDEERGVIAWLQDAESDSGVGARSIGGDLHELYGECCGVPALGLWVPNTGLLQVFIADYCVHETVVIEVEQPDAVVLSVVGAKPLAA